MAFSIISVHLSTWFQLKIWTKNFWKVIKTLDESEEGELDYSHLINFLHNGGNGKSGTEQKSEFNDQHVLVPNWRCE